MTPKALAIGFVIIAALAAACKKDKNDTPEPTPLSKVQGRWNYFRTVTTSFNNNVQISQDTDNGATGDSLVFKADQKVYVYEGGVFQFSAPYSVPSATTIVIDGDTSAITKLTSNELSYLYKESLATFRAEVLTELRR
jgi:hypothetical protein